MSTQNAGWLVWITRIATIIALPCPLVDITRHLIRSRGPIPLPIFCASPGATLQSNFGLLALCCLLLWRFGKLTCGVLAGLTIAVALRRRMEPRTRAMTVAAGSLTCCLLVWWVNTTWQ